MFTENKRKESSSSDVPNNTTQNFHTNYISTINTKKNPDILAPGGLFIKGNKYFSKNVA